MTYIWKSFRLHLEVSQTTVGSHLDDIWSKRGCPTCTPPQARGECATQQLHQNSPDNLIMQLRKFWANFCPQTQGFLAGMRWHDSKVAQQQEIARIRPRARVRASSITASPSTSRRSASLTGRSCTSWSATRGIPHRSEEATRSSLYTCLR